MAKEKIKKPFYKRIWVWVLAIIVIFAIASGGEDDTDAANTNDASKEVTNQTTEEKAGKEAVEPAEEEVKAAKIGEPSTVGDVTFTVNGVNETNEISSGNEFIENATTSGKYIILDITVHNAKNEAITIDSSFFKIIADGTEYDPTTDGNVMMAMGDAMDDFFLAQVNPNLEKSGKVVFEVGADVDVDSALLRAQTGAFGTETTEISLSK
ncbi:DUF4352 domain-containing protein [Bacilli bacterium]|nr:hypothetical protein WH51_16675 [Bacilli bacterium VT-13-104]PZD83114.1 DUF4352 domain-containing protein [Bacilli bacterium]PZD84234.1 DUF4352 domain-containing protein [Bacilli bacterium]PZD88551.1 DUF4352 domain-containing protein [Bacilli bacterium]RCO05149.1 DUF4352 domain-containing protein [Bacilli bacterium]